MKDRKIIIAGGTGFIGEEMTKYFGKDNDIVILSRQLNNTFTNRHQQHTVTHDDLHRTRYVKWDGQTTTGDWVNELENADLIINLAGRSVNCRYSEKNKKDIFDSRISPVNALGAAIRMCSHPPALWVNASSATIYRHAIDRPQDEQHGEIENDFSVQVCKLWENTFYEQSTIATRKVALRMAITLGAGGVLIPYFNLLKFGLGGRQGSGKQMFSWVHIEDTCRMIEWLVEHPYLDGTFNCCSPNPVTNAAFMQTLRKITGHQIGLPAYEWMLKAGALFIGTETELILKSRWVLPTRILATGFKFKYPLLQDAFQEIVDKIPRKQYHLI